MLPAAVTIPSMYSALSSSGLSCCWCSLNMMWALIPAEEKDVKGDRHWPSSAPPVMEYSLASGPGCPRRTWCYCCTSQTLVCLRPTKGAHSCVHGAQDADILPLLSLPHSQSRINSSSRCSRRGNSRLCLPMVPTRLYNTNR